MPAEVETMAFRMEKKEDVPWHGIGFPIDHDVAPEEMLVASGLNWTVSKRPLFTPIGVGSEDVVGGNIRVNDFFALVRDSDNLVLGPAGPDYVPTQNREAFSFFKKFTDSGNLRMETAGSLKAGKQVWVLAKLMRTLTLPGGDEVRGYLLLSSPHIWGKSLVVKFVTIRVVCWNTYSIAMGEGSAGKVFRMPHIRAFDAEAAKEAAITIGLADNMFDAFESSAKILANAPASQDIVVRYIADVMQPAMVEEAFGKSFYKQASDAQARDLADKDAPKLNVMELKSSAFEVFTSSTRSPGATMESSAGTMWGAFNGFTYYADHLAGAMRDNALESAWFGDKARLKVKALQRGVQIAEHLQK